jgi:uncharacterized protein (TIGR00730 family)
MSRDNGLDRASIFSQIDQLLAQVRPDADSDERRLLRDLVFTSVLVARDRPDRLNLKIMARALRELRQGFNAFAPWSDKRKVAIFGSARLSPGSDAYRMAEACAYGLVQAGYMVVTGAGPGVMEAANKGAGADQSFGVNIELPFEQRANPFVDPKKLVTFKYFFTRKVVFVKETDAVILFPGGFGTQDEGFETLTLVQTGKCEPRPIVMIEPPGSTYWEEWDRYVRGTLLHRGLISADDLDLYRIVRDPAAAISQVVHFYRNFHSIRYIGQTLFIRVVLPPGEALLAQLNASFSDIVRSGRIEACGPHPVEDDEPGVNGLHRLKLDFDQRHLGRLRRLIDVLNDAVTEEQIRTAPSLPAVHHISPAADPPAPPEDEP